MQVPSKVNNAEQLAKSKKASDEALAKKNSLLQASRIEENDNKSAHKEESTTKELLEKNIIGKETPVDGNLEKKSDIQNSDKDESKDTSNANLSGGGKVSLEANSTVDSTERHTLNGVPIADAKNVEANQNDEAGRKMSSISSATPTGLSSVVSDAQSAVSGVLTGTPSVGAGAAAGDKTSAPAASSATPTGLASMVSGAQSAVSGVLTGTTTKDAGAAAGDKTSASAASSATPTGLASMVSGAQSIFANEGKSEIFFFFINLLYLTI